MELIFLIILFPVTLSVKHSFKFFVTATSGAWDIPDFVGSAMVDEVQVAYCDSNIGTSEPKQDWAKKFMKDNPQHLEYYIDECYRQREFLRTTFDSLMKSLNQTGGAHILQRMYGCEWDDETEEIRGFNQYGYDGEDFIALDLQTLTWNASKPEAVITKLKWDTEKSRLEDSKYYHIQLCPDWLKIYINYARSFLQKTDPPSVSLLQKTPSSPVSCHATGFYPDRAEMFWRKDGLELHEDVNKGEILPNHDGTFQMSVDLKISSIPTEDWKKYDCVFQLAGVEGDHITKLDKSVIRSNQGNSLAMIIPIVVAVVVLAVIAVVGFFVYKKKQDKRPPSPVENKEVKEEMLPQA